MFTHDLYAYYALILLEKNGRKTLQLVEVADLPGAVPT